MPVAAAATTGHANPAAVVTTIATAAEVCSRQLERSRRASRDSSPNPRAADPERDHQKEPPPPHQQEAAEHEEQEGALGIGDLQQEREGIEAEEHRTPERRGVPELVAEEVIQRDGRRPAEDHRHGDAGDGEAQVGDGHHAPHHQWIQG
jgi:hypothetical protein